MMPEGASAIGGFLLSDGQTVTVELLKGKRVEALTFIIIKMTLHPSREMDLLLPDPSFTDKTNPGP